MPARPARTTLCCAALWVCFALSCAGPLFQLKQPQPPNIILIVADDQAFGDFGFMGHTIVQTPHLDRLAAESALYRNGYVPSSLCRASLASLLTGLSPRQHGIYSHSTRRADGTFLSVASGDQAPGHKIRNLHPLPGRLAQAGYRSFQSGKFWEGHYSNAGFSHGMTQGTPRVIVRHPGLGTLRGRHGDLGLTIGRDGMQPIYDFIEDAEADSDAPFFVWYAPFMPHTPHNPPAIFEWLYGKPGELSAAMRYYAMISWFDATVGELLSYLDRSGHREDTIVVFLVDNGWVLDAATAEKGNPNLSQPLWYPGFDARSKRSPFEAGVRTPLLIRWPGRVQPGERDLLVSSLDIVPTLLAAAGADDTALGRLPGSNPLQPLRSPARVSLAPKPIEPADPSDSKASETEFNELESNELEVNKLEAVPSRAVFGVVYPHDATSEETDPSTDWRYRWVRHDNWKLIQAKSREDEDFLFDLYRDALERNNLIYDGDVQEVLHALRLTLEASWER